MGVRDVTVGEVNALRRRSLADATRATVYDPRMTQADDNAFDLVIDAVGANEKRGQARISAGQLRALRHPSAEIRAWPLFSR